MRTKTRWTNSVIFKIHHLIDGDQQIHIRFFRGWKRSVAKQRTAAWELRKVWRRTVLHEHPDLSPYLSLRPVPPTRLSISRSISEVSRREASTKVRTSWSSPEKFIHRISLQIRQSLCWRIDGEWKSYSKLSMSLLLFCVSNRIAESFWSSAGGCAWPLAAFSWYSWSYSLQNSVPFWGSASMFKKSPCALIAWIPIAAASIEQVYRDDALCDDSELDGRADGHREYGLRFHIFFFENTRICES